MVRHKLQRILCFSDVLWGHYPSASIFYTRHFAVEEAALGTGRRCTTRLNAMWRMVGRDRTGTRGMGRVWSIDGWVEDGFWGGGKISKRIRSF